MWHAHDELGDSDPILIKIVVIQKSFVIWKHKPEDNAKMGKIK